MQNLPGLDLQMKLLRVGSHFPRRSISSMALESSAGVWITKIFPFMRSTVCLIVSNGVTSSREGPGLRASATAAGGPPLGAGSPCQLPAPWTPGRA